MKFIHDRERRNLVRNREVDPDKFQFRQQTQCGFQFFGRDLETRVLHLDLAVSQRGVLHFRRKRMSHRIAEDAETNRRIDIARRLFPVLEIGERVDFFHRFVCYCRTQQ